MFLHHIHHSLEGLWGTAITQQGGVSFWGTEREIYQWDPNLYFLSHSLIYTAQFATAWQKLLLEELHDISVAGYGYGLLGTRPRN